MFDRILIPRAQHTQTRITTYRLITQEAWLPVWQQYSTGTFIQRLTTIRRQMTLIQLPRSITFYSLTRYFVKTDYYSWGYFFWLVKSSLSPPTPDHRGYRPPPISLHAQTASGKRQKQWRDEDLDQSKCMSPTIVTVVKAISVHKNKNTEA
jgi:hypothetical protein